MILNFFLSFIRYIYTDKININSIDKACELCYVAKKYMLPFVVQKCTEFLWSDLSAKNVCRAFEFAKLFEEPELAERCLQVWICDINKVKQKRYERNYRFSDHLHSNERCTVASQFRRHRTTHIDGHTGARILTYWFRDGFVFSAGTLRRKAQSWQDDL